MRIIDHEWTRTGYDRSLRDRPSMASRTSPSWILPLCAAGWLGKSCFIRIKLLKSLEGGSSSHIRKLKPRPLALFVRVTSWVLSEGLRWKDMGCNRIMMRFKGQD